MAEESSYPSPSEWYCDRCGGTITDPNNSLVVWQMDDDYRDHGYLIVHKGRCDPGSKGPGSYTMSMDISAFQGWDGQSYLLSMLSDGPFHMKVLKTKGGIPPKDLHEFVELFRRLQTPYYEEARRHFRCEGVKDAYWEAGTEQVYRPDALHDIATHDGECGWA